MKIHAYLSQSPIFALYRGHAQIVEAFQTQLKEEGVHLLQALILTALLFEEREVRPTELAQVFQVSKSNLSHALRGLEKSGWLRRAMHREDARGYHFSLTAAGRRKAQTLIKIFDRTEQNFDEVLGKQGAKEFSALVENLISHFETRD